MRTSFSFLRLVRRLRSLSLAGCVSAALLAGCVAGRPGPRERDAWSAFVADEQRYGYEHVMVTRLADGNYQYQSESRLLLDLMGAGEQEYTSTSRYVVTPRFQPVSFESEGRQAVGAVRAAGRAQDGKLVVEYERAGVAGSATIDLSNGALLKACLDDWLHSQPPSSEKVEANLIDEDRWRVQTSALTRVSNDAGGSAWAFDLGVDGGRGVTTYDANGAFVETRMTIPKLHVKRCTAEEARDIKCRVLVGRDVLMFPVNKDIGNPAQLTSLTIKLTWKDIPFDQFALEDARQRIVSQSDRGGGYEAVLRISPPEPVTGQLAYPIGGEEFAPYLAECRYVKPLDERIVATAREAVAGKTTALAAVEALSAFVFKYIHGAMIAETLSGPEILECRQGKCTEYAILFASLARAVGIPTRIVLGERMVGGSWAGHMWNEAYVGEWVTVDASANTVGGSFELVKLIHSDTVMGTQALRWALTDSLEISIEQFEARRPALADKYKTGVEPGPRGSVYTNVDYSCRLTAPVADWTTEEKSERGVATIRFHVPNAEDVLIHFVPFALPAGVAPEMLVQSRLNLFRKYDDFEVVKNEACDVAGVSGWTLQFRRTEPEAEGGGRRRMLTTEFVWVRGTSGYLLNLIAEEGKHEEHLAEFQKLLESFEFLAE